MTAKFHAPTGFACYRSDDATVVRTPTSHTIGIKMARDECEVCWHEMFDCWCEPRCGLCNRRRSSRLQHGVRFWFTEDDEGMQSWYCERCVDWDPKCTSVRSDKEGYIQWMSYKRAKPSRTPDNHMQTWPEFCEWGIVVDEKRSSEQSRAPR